MQHQETSTQGRQVQDVRNTKIKDIKKTIFSNLFLDSSKFDLSDGD